MKQRYFLAILLTVCLSSPFAAFFLYNKGYHGSGYTNKGHLLPLDKKITVTNKAKWYLIANSKKLTDKMHQIKRALGRDGFKVSVLNKNISGHFSVYIADPNGNIILGYNGKNWQENAYSDLKHLIKIN